MSTPLKFNDADTDKDFDTETDTDVGYTKTY